MLKYLQFLIIMMLFVNLHAQDKIEIEEKKMKMSQGVQNGLSIFIPASDQKFTEKLWKKKMKDLKAKVSKVNNDLLATNIDMYNISDNSINIYIHCKNAIKGIQLNIFFDMGESYLTSYLHEDSYKSAEQFCYNFALSTAKNALRTKYEEENKSFKKISEELNYLKSSNERMNNSIEKWTQNINKTQEDIKTNLTEQETKKGALNDQEYNLQKAQERLNNIK